MPQLKQIGPFHSDEQPRISVTWTETASQTIGAISGTCAIFDDAGTYATGPCGISINGSVATLHTYATLDAHGGTAYTTDHIYHYQITGQATIGTTTAIRTFEGSFELLP